MIRGVGPFSSIPKVDVALPEPVSALGEAFTLPDDALDPRPDDGDRRDPDGSLLAGAALGRHDAQDAARAARRDGHDGVDASGGHRRRGGREMIARPAEGSGDPDDAALAAKNAADKATQTVVADDGLGGAFVSDDAAPPPAPEAPARDARAADGAKTAPEARGEGHKVAHGAAERPVQAPPAEAKGDGKGGDGQGQAQGKDAAAVDAAKNAGTGPQQAQSQAQGGTAGAAQAGALGVPDAGSLLRLAGAGGKPAGAGDAASRLVGVGEIDPLLGPDAMGSAAARGAAAQKVVPVTPGQPLADQLADAVRDMVNGDAGGDLIRFEAKDIGRFTALVQHDGRELLVHLRADDAATRALLEQRLPDVKAALERAGLASGGVDVRADGGAGGGSERHSQGPSDGAAGVAGAPGARRGGARHAVVDGASGAEPGRLHIIA